MNLDPLYSAFKQISTHLRNNDGVYLGADNNTYNNSTDMQKHIDIYANDVIKRAISEIPEIIGIVSEEDNAYTEKTENTENTEKEYVVIFDPVDGSKNVYSNISVGTIYGIYEYDKINDKILGVYESGYCLYGPSTVLVHTYNNEVVQQFHLNSDNNFIYERDLTLVTKNSIYCINMAYKFDNDIKTLVLHLVREGSTQRWCGSMVADVHHIIMRGGTFIYPMTDKNPSGKIRLLYEALPLSHVFDVMGGCAIDTNKHNIMDKLRFVKLRQTSVHNEIPIIMSTVYSANELINILDINDLIKC